MVTLVVVLFLGLGRLGVAAHERGRAQAVADLAALAAAAHGPTAAALVCDANGAALELVDIASSGEVRVTVTVGAGTAGAAATTRSGEPEGWLWRN